MTLAPIVAVEYLEALGALAVNHDLSMAITKLSLSNRPAGGWAAALSASFLTMPLSSGSRTPGECPRRL
jgi:hypothetical protein